MSENYTEFYSQLQKFVARRIERPEDAEEIVQEVFSRLVKNQSDISQDSIGPWLFRVARNAITDFYRKSGRSDSEFDEKQVEVGVEEEEREIKTCMNLLVLTLEDEEKELLTAIDIEGKSQKEYAEDAGLPYATLRSKIQRARSKLKSHLLKYCKARVDSKGVPLELDANDECC